MSETMYDRIVERLTALNKSERGAALEAGLSEAAIRNIKRGSSQSPRGVTIEKLAKVLETTEQYLRYGTGPSAALSSQPDLPRASIIPGAELVSSLRMPVYAAAQGGEGHIIVTFEAIDQVKRPAELENVRGGYGLLIKGDSMVPALSEGDLALVNPHLPPARDKNVILYHTPPDGGEVEAIVKQLTSWNDREWSLKQWNPFKEFKEFRQEWPICHRLVGTYYGR